MNLRQRIENRIQGSSPKNSENIDPKEKLPIAGSSEKEENPQSIKDRGEIGENTDENLDSRHQTGDTSNSEPQIAANAEKEDKETKNSNKKQNLVYAGLVGLLGFSIAVGGFIQSKLGETRRNLALRTPTPSLVVEGLTAISSPLPTIEPVLSTIEAILPTIQAIEPTSIASNNLSAPTPSSLTQINELSEFNSENFYIKIMNPIITYKGEKDQTSIRLSLATGQLGTVVNFKDGRITVIYNSSGQNYEFQAPFYESDLAVIGNPYTEMLLNFRLDENSLSRAINCNEFFEGCTLITQNIK
jgi:hypothetical protein